MRWIRSGFKGEGVGVEMAMGAWACRGPGEPVRECWIPREHREPHA